MADTTSSTDPVLIEAARSSRPYLTELVGEKAASEVDREIASLLTAALAGEDVTDALAARLTEPAALRDWVAAFFEFGVPIDIARPPVRGSDLPGGPSSAIARRFVCPLGDYVWYRHGMSSTMPPCPTHAVALVPADMGHGE